MEQQLSFFEKNDTEVSLKLSKITIKMMVVFPALIVLTVLKVFNIDMTSLIILSIVGLICTLAPTVMVKMKVPVGIVKYAAVLSIGCIVMLLGGNSGIGIYMTYGLGMALSCMYYDPKFTKKIAIVSGFLLAISLYIRAPGASAQLGEEPMAWYIPHLIGFLIEQLIMSAVFIKLAAGSRKILEGLQNTEQVIEVVDKCEEVSSKLVGIVDELAGNMEELKGSTTSIIDSASRTHDDCEKSLNHVNNMNESINQMVEAVEEIGVISNETIDVANSITQKMDEYVTVMEQAADSMKDIDEAASQTGEAIDNLEVGIAEIADFVVEITNISAQTNMLALNASIEAARAGEHGRGFAVVAEQVRVLADRSKKSSGQIGVMLDTINSKLSDVKQYNEKNIENVTAGIEKINNAKDEAKNLGQIQAGSIEKTKSIVEHSNITKKHGEIVKDMASEMGTLVAQSIEQVDSICDEANNQDLINKRTGDTFTSVEQVAKDLLETSKIEF